jgi:hypothetical protein
MLLRLAPLALGISAALAAFAVHEADAHACGGCFHPEDQPETTVVTAHRMALSISPAQTVLWDQVEYAGAPEEFAWVLPIKAGARLQLSTDAWFEALDAATSTRVVGPALSCGFGGGEDDSRGCGCMPAQYESSVMADNGAGAAGPIPPVTVVHREAVGPYDVVTLHASTQGSLTSWLTENGFAIDTSTQPIIDAYTLEGFDFIALRLLPDRGVQQMKPVRVVSEGAVPTLPLRMVAAGTGANVDITLFVVGEGRWQTRNFPDAVVDAADLSWDFAASASSYGELRQGVFAQDEGRTWLSTYAKRGALLGSLTNPIDGSPVLFQQGNASFATIADLYVSQGLANDETDTDACTTAFAARAGSAELVVDPCPSASIGDGGGGGAGGNGSGGGAGGGSCGVVESGEIDARELACGKLDDVAVALTGTHPRDVWITRLESKLPRAALKDDLSLEAAPEQTPVENWLRAAKADNAPCPLKGAAAVARGDDDAPGGPGPSARARTDAALLATGVAAALAALLRRARRPALAFAPIAARARR